MSVAIKQIVANTSNIKSHHLLKRSQTAVVSNRLLRLVAAFT